MILNIAAYHFVHIDAPEVLAAWVRERAEALSLRGTVLVAGEGINVFLAGDESGIRDFLTGLKADERFAAWTVAFEQAVGSSSAVALRNRLRG